MPLEDEQEAVDAGDGAKKAAQAIWDELDREDSGDEGAADQAPRGEPAQEGQAPRQVEPQQASTQDRSPAGTALSDEERALLRQIPDVVQLVKATVGRVGSIQSQLATMGKAAAQQSAGPAPTAKQIDKAAVSPEKWEALKKDFPDWAEGVEAYVASRTPSASPAVDPQALARHIEGQLAKRLQAQREEDAMEVVSAFDADWQKKASTQEFRAWIESQPAEYQQRALSTWKPSEILATMRDFDASMKQQKPAAQPKARLASTVIPRATSRPNLSKPVEEMTPGEYWAYLDSQEAKQARA